MRKLIIIAVTLALLFPLISSTAIAQDVPQSQLYWIQEANVAPSRAQAYEANIKEVVSLFQENKYSTPVSVSMGSNATYAFILSFPDFATIGKVFSEYQTMTQKKEFDAIFKKDADMSNGENIWLAMSRPDLSYTPENPRLKQGEALFSHIFYFYIRSGAQAQMDAVLKKFVELFKKHKIDMGFSSVVAITGVNLPLYVTGQSAKSASDYWTAYEKNVTICGEEWEILLSELNSILRSADQRDFTQRPDLSYTPEQ